MSEEVIHHRASRKSGPTVRKVMLCCSAVLSCLFAARASRNDPFSCDWRPAERWRGFNLGALFQWSPDREKKTPEFREEDFRLISEFGFNFVRLPLDYRFWTHGGDWRKIDPARLEIIDRAIGYGVDSGVHVQLCFHRIPGYCVNAPPEPKNLFKDAEALSVAQLHWATFAERYRRYSNKEVSFNLVNEPGGITDKEYARVAEALIAAIRGKDPKRLVFSDGLSGGHYPSSALAGKRGVAQAVHCYAPLAVSHYRAPWCSVAIASRPPQWPPNADSPAGLLAGPAKKHLRDVLTLEDLPAGELTIHVAGVSDFVKLEVTADGAAAAGFTLRPDEKSDEWDLVSIHPEWGGIRQGGLKKPLSLRLSEPVGKLGISVTEGDWCTLSGVSITTAQGRTAMLPVIAEFAKPVYFRQRFKGFSASGAFEAVRDTSVPSKRMYKEPGMEFLYRRSRLAEWDRLAEKGVWVMVGESGSPETLPASVNLAWMEDNLRLWKERNWSWAMWGFRGLFGVLDSDRPGAVYENYKGHKLDRRFLELLQRY